jgi:hypothetical protein
LYETTAVGGVLVLDARLVDVSPDFAASYATKTEIPYTIEAGVHFATVLRSDVENGPPPSIDFVEQPQEVVDIWAFDSWLCNIDRNTDGNLLLCPAKGGKFRLIAADQSDCFGGARCFADGSWQEVLQGRGPAETVHFWQAAIMDAGGAAALYEAVGKVRRAGCCVDEAVAACVSRLVGHGWDRRPCDRQCSGRETPTPEDILNIKQWEGLDNDIKGGRLF